ncbi:MAG: hypothetical protein KatS3mg002_0606 [Candidatus Woesearchaeota archaeon]|nr:MAG: hypothetical protein KatS3mg002_0606 [Candidatus Woesearchaeota archaeon]
MAKESTDLLAKVGSWAFIIGVIVALILGIFEDVQKNAIATSILVVLGLIVGFLNVTGRETTPFLLASLSLVLVSEFGGNALAQVEYIGSALGGTLTALLFFVVPATIIVALKAIYALAHDE